MNLDFKFMLTDIPVVFSALHVTLLLAVTSLFLAVILAVIFGTLIIRKTPVASQIVLALTTFLKGVPLVVQLLFCYYAIPHLLAFLSSLSLIHYDPRNASYFAFAVTAFAFNYGAYITDVVISSYRAVDRGQLEAAYTVGMTPVQALIHIVIPQAVVISLPNLGNYFMWILKATSLASVVNVFEILSVAKASTADNYAILEGYIVAAGIYWAVCLAAEKIIGAVNRKMNRYGKRLNVS